MGRVWVRGALALTVAVVVGLYGVVLSRTSLFDARSIRVSGNVHLRSDQVQRLAGVSGSTNVLWMNPASAVHRLLDDPWISHASVTRSLPWTVSIKITERAPIGIERSDGGAQLVFSDGTALGRVGPSEHLPTVAAGAGSIDDAAAALGAFHPGLLRQVLSASGSSDSTVRITMKNGTQVNFGTSDQAAAKAQALSAVMGWAAARHVRVLSIDVSAPSAPTAKLAGGSVVAP